MGKTMIGKMLVLSHVRVVVLVWIMIIFPTFSSATSLRWEIVPVGGRLMISPELAFPFSLQSYQLGYFSIAYGPLSLGSVLLDGHIFQHRVAGGVYFWETEQMINFSVTHRGLFTHFPIVVRIESETPGWPGYGMKSAIYFHYSSWCKTDLDQRFENNATVYTYSSRPDQYWDVGVSFEKWIKRWIHFKIALGYLHLDYPEMHPTVAEWVQMGNSERSFYLSLGVSFGLHGKLFSK